MIVLVNTTFQFNVSNNFGCFATSNEHSINLSVFYLDQCLASICSDLSLYSQNHSLFKNTKPSTNTQIQTWPFSNSPV